MNDMRLAAFMFGRCAPTFVAMQQAAAVELQTLQGAHRNEYSATWDVNIFS
jgi:hypothetical protein